jgi:uncharacterized protein (TIGR03083 family)
VQLQPRYDGAPILQIRAGLPNPATAMLRQRRRLAKVLGELSAADWATPSRCEGWTAQDVVTHLVSTNQFWTISVAQGVAGTPTRFLATFDPVASPAQMVEQARGKVSPAETLEQFTTSVDALAAAVEPLSDAQVATVIAEAPPGHVPLDAVLRHALWDAWIHERDILEPLGLTQDREDDELASCLAYAAALGPAFALANGRTEISSFVVGADDPRCHFVVTPAGDDPSAVEVLDGAEVDLMPPVPSIGGDAVELIEAFSFRAPFPPDLDPTIKRLVAGLADVFDTEVA